MNQRLSSSTPTTDWTPSEAVVHAVAEAEGTSPLDLRPLATAIDPDELDSLVDSMSTDPRNPNGRITFAYLGYEVTVTERGDVSLHERRA